MLVEVDVTVPTLEVTVVVKTLVPAIAEPVPTVAVTVVVPPEHALTVDVMTAVDVQTPAR